MLPLVSFFLGQSSNPEQIRANLCWRILDRYLVANVLQNQSFQDGNAPRMSFEKNIGPLDLLFLLQVGGDIGSFTNQVGKTPDIGLSLSFVFQDQHWQHMSTSGL